ncbi:MAG TPA: DUF1543 domain-containing protein [Flavobacterium sp.]|nr:DUF1543 domain-containing protein [Flavobacterium sp.]
MNENPKLYMAILGATPEGRLTEQHDVFFGIGKTLAELVPQMKAFWPEAKGRIHIDSWREVTVVGGYKINVAHKNQSDNAHLFFINLGGYKENDLEEYHYKILAVAETMAEAARISKQTAFYKHYGFKGAESHIDDKYGIDVDDIHNVHDILNPLLRREFSLQISKSAIAYEDELHIGYLRIEKLEKENAANPGLSRTERS